MRVLPSLNLNRFFISLATGFGVGKIKWAPGTWGAFITLPFALSIMMFPYFHMLICVLLTAFGVVSAHIYLNQDQKQSFTQRQKKHLDPSEVVIDEMIGMLISLVWLPVSFSAIAVGFILFRCLDILKPFPISWFDKNGKGGVGIVADDVVAGIITNILVHYLLKVGWLS